MATILYEANPSLVRKNPFGTVLMILLILVGIAIAIWPGLILDTVGIGSDIENYRKAAQIGGMVVAALSFFILLYWWIPTKLDHLKITDDDEVVWEHGLLNKEIMEINMRQIRATQVKRSIMQRIFGAGDVLIYTAGDEPELIVRGLPDPDRIRDLIKSKSAED